MKMTEEKALEYIRAIKYGLKKGKINGVTAGALLAFVANNIGKEL